MPLRVFEQVEFGGVDSRSNPMDEPNTRCLRCFNWVAKEDGHLELRWGYSTVTMSQSTTTALNTIIPYTLWSGTQFYLLQYGPTWWVMDTSGNITVPPVRGAAWTSSNHAFYYLYNNHIHVGNQNQQKWFDGTTWRDNGLRAANSTDSGGVTVSQGANDTTGLPKSTVGGSNPGYQFYFSIYNPNTGHVGNRISIGARLANSTNCDVSITGLPSLAEDTEFTWVIGRTRDGGTVPYVVTDAAGNWINVPNGNSSITITSGVIDGNFELPTRNGVIPSQTAMYAVVGDYIWAAQPNAPTVFRSGSKLDANQGIFMGLPEQSWAPNDIMTFPTGQSCRAIFEVDSEVLVCTQNDCAIITDLAGVPAWRGPWPVGVAGIRAGTKTHHGFFWVSADKELCTFVNGLPTPISEEYELAELAQFGDAFLISLEVVYYRDKTKGKDELRITGQKGDGTPYTVIHDFRLRDQRSPYGQAYSAQYLGNLSTFFTSAIVRDINGKLQVYCGGSNGQVYQMYSGGNDAGNEFSADLIALVNGGLNRTSTPWLDWHGDPNLAVSVGRQLKTSPNSTAQFTFIPLTSLDNPGQAVQGYEDSFLFRAKMTIPEILHVYLRLQLTSHSADGDLTLNSPPHCPLEWYGRVYDLIPAAGAERGR